MKIKQLSITLLALTFSPLLSATVLDFEGFGSGTIIDNEYVSLGVAINGVNVVRSASNLATIFDTNNYSGGDWDLASPFSNPNGDLGTLDPGNVLIVHEHPWECNGMTCTDPDDEGDRLRDPDSPSVYFSIVFDTPVFLESIDFFDIENEEDGFQSYNAIQLFDWNGVEIMPNTFYTPDTGGDRTWDRLAFNVAGVKSMRINLGGSGAIDNIHFVPEPDTFVLFLLGLTGMGLFMAWQRKYRKKAVIPATKMSPGRHWSK